MRHIIIDHLRRRQAKAHGGGWQARFFGGYAEVEAAEALGLSDRTVRRHWKARGCWRKP